MKEQKDPERSRAQLLDAREVLVTLVREADLCIDGDAERALLGDNDYRCDPEDAPANMASAELDTLLDEHPYDDEPGKRRYTEHADHLVRVAVLILNSAAAWYRRAQPKPRAPKPPDPQAKLFGSAG